MRKRVLLAGAVAALAGVASARPVYTAAGPVPIPDAGPGDCLTSPPGAPATLDVVVPDSMTISSMKVGVYITHTWQADLKFTIEKVGGGPVVTLIDRAGNPTTACGFAEDNYGSSSASLFVLDDASALIYDNPPLAFGITGVSGSYKPESALSAFNGTNSQGTWRLSVNDNANLDIGNIEFVSLTIVGGVVCYPDCNGVGGLTIADFGCFQTRFVAQDPYADCNGVGGLTIADFACFQTKFVQGCP